MTVSDTDNAVAAFLAQGGKIKRMPKRSATGPAIKKIRRALKHNRAITFKRGPSGRTVTFRRNAAQN
jgi:hypothetical protein